MTSKQLAAIDAWFDAFVARFIDGSVEEQRNYQLKIEHTRNVRQIMTLLATVLELPLPSRRLAEAIAICHDVGRFPQYRDFRTFNDPVSVNHATLALQTLKAEGVISGISPRERNLLQQAIALHNVFTLPVNLDPQLDLLSRLIRDADKLDIWRVLIEYCTTASDARASAVAWGLPDHLPCSDEVLEVVCSGRLVDRNLLRSSADYILLQLSWVFDLNFSASFRLLAERRYIATLAALLPDQPACRDAVEVVCRHLRLQAGIGSCP